MDNYTGRDYINNVWQWMVEYWKLQHPKLIISVSGGAKQFDLHSRLSNALKKGLVNSAAKTGTVSNEPIYIYSTFGISRTAISRILP